MIAQRVFSRPSTCFITMYQGIRPPPKSIVK